LDENIKDLAREIIKRLRPKSSFVDRKVNLVKIENILMMKYK